MLQTQPLFHYMVWAGSFLATTYMLGVIWVIQRVHYPLFHRVFHASAPEAFAGFEAEHCRRITPVVAPAMLLELASTALCLQLNWSGVLRTQAEPLFLGLLWLGAACLILIWLSTVGLQMPLHRKLSLGYDALTVDQLVRTNWIRTVAWLLRFVLMAGAGGVLWFGQP
ncbi:MAG: hypothetical protein SFZ03_03745 [Candidatus Melainabacteria bacterium]|nr:hypothetical protein [Candidatus Melainabacteria bacterium]